MPSKVEITYHCEALVSTAQYESVRFFYGEKVEVDREEFGEARASMIRRVNSTVERQVADLRAALGKEPAPRKERGR